jgi:hypothetical protein
MPRVGEPHVKSASSDQTALVGGVRRTHLRIARAANDNHSIHTPWRRFVAAGMAVLFAASIILVGLVCIARAGELLAPFIIGN